MIGVFNTIRINGTDIYRGNDFTLEREYIYAGEYETCTGRRISDVIGWRYADTTIEWDTLPQDMLSVILGLTGLAVNFRFSNELGSTVTEVVIPQVVTSQATRYTNPYDGSVIWKNVQLQLKFVNPHSI